MTRVLIVDDESPAAHPLRADLVACLYEVLGAKTGDAALDVIVEEQLDLVLLDLGPAGADAVAAVRELRAWTTVPMIVLSGPPGTDHKINALDAGADDYLAKPVSVLELLARIRAIVRRQTGDLRTTSVRIGRYEVDLRTHRVDGIDGTDQRVSLTRTEWQLLEALVAAPGKLIPQRQLLERIWGPGYCGKTQNLRQYMAQLRRKFEIDPGQPRHLLTEWGVGCRFQP
jgi:two-component system KDP operon response regulator KdpE